MVCSPIYLHWEVKLLLLLLLLLLLSLSSSSSSSSSSSCEWSSRTGKMPFSSHGRNKAAAVCWYNSPARFPGPHQQRVATWRPWDAVSCIRYVATQLSLMPAVSKCSPLTPICVGVGVATWKALLHLYISLFPMQTPVEMSRICTFEITTRPKPIKKK